MLLDTGDVKMMSPVVGLGPSDTGVCWLTPEMVDCEVTARFLCFNCLNKRNTWIICRK